MPRLHSIAIDGRCLPGTHLRRPALLCWLCPRMLLTSCCHHKSLQEA